MSTPTQLSQQAQAAIPTHVAVIMDGNGRWAKQRGLQDAMERSNLDRLVAWNSNVMFALRLCCQSHVRAGLSDNRIAKLPQCFG